MSGDAQLDRAGRWTREVTEAAPTMAAVYCHQWRTTFPTPLTHTESENLRELPIVQDGGRPVMLHPSLVSSDASLWETSASDGPARLTAPPTAAPLPNAHTNTAFLSFSRVPPSFNSHSA